MDFPPVCIYLFLLKLVKASHFPSELRCSALEHAQVCAPSVPIYTDRSKSSGGVGYATVFPELHIFISLPVVASIFTVELCAIFLTFSHISFHYCDSFFSYTDSPSALHALRSLYTRNPSVLKINASFVTSTPIKNLSPSAGFPNM